MLNQYSIEILKQIFLDNFKGPDILPHAKEIRIATYAHEDNSDGYDVEVYVNAMPKMLYIIKVLPTKDSMGNLQDGFVLETGGIDAKWIHVTALLLSRGMVGMRI